MYKKWIIALIFSYIFSFSMNLIVSLKYPDMDISLLHLLATTTFFIIFLRVMQELIPSKNKLSIRFLICGVLAGPVIYCMTQLEYRLYDNNIFDVITAIKYPLYLVFITPFFWVNALLGLQHDIFSIVVSFIFIVIFFVYRKRENINTIFRGLID